MRLTVVQLGDIRIMLIKNQLGPALSKSFSATLPAGTGTEPREVCALVGLVTF